MLRSPATRSSRGRRVAAAALVTVSVGAVVYLAGATPLRLTAASGAGQSAPQAQIARTIGTRITFTITQSTEFAAGSNDQITILFSDRSWEGPTAPAPFPLFGDDIQQEFSFSARDFEKSNQLTFTRFVKDQSFLSARFIRLINHGGEGWGGGTITMLVDGQPILNKEPLQPRKGAGKKGFQDWNRVRWSDRTYWEKELPRSPRKY